MHDIQISPMNEVLFSFGQYGTAAAAGPQIYRDNYSIQINLLADVHSICLRGRRKKCRPKTSFQFDSLRQYLEFIAVQPKTTHRIVEPPDDGEIRSLHHVVHALAVSCVTSTDNAYRTNRGASPNGIWLHLASVRLSTQ